MVCVASPKSWLEVYRKSGIHRYDAHAANTPPGHVGDHQVTLGEDGLAQPVSRRALLGHMGIDPRASRA